MTTEPAAILQQTFANSGIFEPTFSLQSPYMADYFGLWMAEEQTFRSLVNRVNGTNLHLHLQSIEVQNAVKERDGVNYMVDDDGTAMLSLRGPMMKAVPSMSDGTSYIRFRQQINAARRDPQVTSAILMMDTPGGTARGNEDAVDAVAKFASEKPIYAFVEDMTASAGVSIASQATKRYANNKTATYGSMGTFAVVQDLSGMAEKLGVTVHVIKAGDFKGMGTAGTEVTEQQLQELQRIVNAMNENYLGLIARGLRRSVDSIRAVADGRVIMASDAVELGLLNGIRTLEETKQELRETVSPRTQVSMPHQRDTTMSEDKKPVTLQELKQNFPNSTADWRETQLEAGNDLSQSALAYAQHVEQVAAAKEEQHKKELEEAKAAAKPGQSSSIGHQPLTSASLQEDGLLETGDAVQDFNAAVAARLPRNRSATYQERMGAIAATARANPQLHQSYLLATNKEGGKKVQRLLEEKFDPAA